MGPELACGRTTATYDELAAVKTPLGTDTYIPVKHADLVRMVRRGITADLGLEILAEAFKLGWNGRYMFGVVVARPATTRDGYGLAIAVQNGHDARLPAAFACGRCMVASGGLLFRDAVVCRHTSVGAAVMLHEFAALLRQVPATMGLLAEEVAQLRCRLVDDDDVYSLMGLAYGRGHLTSDTLSTAAQAWHKPPYDELKPRTLWSAYNAFAEALKANHPKDALASYIGLYSLFGEWLHGEMP